MKKVEKVSIGGYAFTMDADASAAAEEYMKEMEEFYSNREITDGIEERMAELLHERTAGDGVVSKDTVMGIIDILGRPEKIEETQPDDDTQDRPRKKLYRDMENAKVAGVCSGLGAYLNVDTAVFRLLFVILTFVGFFFDGYRWGHYQLYLTVPIIYVILWICIPAARTARQRWESKGEDGTAEDIRRTIEKGASEVGDAITKVSNDPAWSGVGRVLETVVGLLLIIIAVSGLFAGALAVFGWEWLGLSTYLSELLMDITRDFSQAAEIFATPWVKALALVVYILPFLGMLYGGIMLLFKFKSPSWHPGLVIFVLWLIALVALGILILACVFSAGHAFLSV